MDPNVIDLPEVLERVQDDKELLLELFDIFTDDYKEKLVGFKAAIGQKDLEAIKDIIHSIKGAAGNISAKAMHAVCVAVEQSALAKDMSGVESRLPLLEQKFAELEKRIAELKKEFAAQ